MLTSPSVERHYVKLMHHTLSSSFRLYGSTIKQSCGDRDSVASVKTQLNIGEEALTLDSSKGQNSRKTINPWVANVTQGIYLTTRKGASSPELKLGVSALKI